ncbi:MAG TPA: T9SS type A sorting domain-containing protein [Chitinophagales bacterium]|nr:T9SS type A sorting domain-containing protein [Chitinophagales bacterium]
MKTLIYLLIILSLPLASYAQSWCPAGAEWHYGYYYWNQVGDIHYRYTKDTVVEASACKKIEIIHYNGQHYNSSPYFVVDTLMPKPIYTYEQSDTVFFYYEESNTWKPVYFFNAQVGDTLTMPITDIMHGGDTYIHVVVDSVGNEIINDSTLHYYHFRLADSCIQAHNLRGRVSQTLGMQVNNLVPTWYCVSDQHDYFFCSYKDSTFPVYPSTANCQLRPVGIEEITGEEAGIHLYPNPANEMVSITILKSEQNNTITISDATGKIVSTFVENDSPITLSTDNYLPGIYIVTLYNHAGFKLSKRLVIMR